MGVGLVGPLDVRVGTVINVLRVGLDEAVGEIGPEVGEGLEVREGFEVGGRVG